MARRLVLIEWLDSFGCSSSWQDLNGCEAKPMVCHSVGWLAYDGDDCKVIVPHLAKDANQGCGDMTIPTKAIRSTVDLIPETTGTSTHLASS